MLVGIFFYWGNMGCLFFGCGDGQIFWELQLGIVWVLWVEFL